MRFHTFWCISFLSSEFLNHVQKTPKSWEKICSITILHQDLEKTLLQAWKPLKIAFILPISFSDNHGQKSWDTFAFLGVFQFTQVQPLLSHHKQCWMYVSRIFFWVSTLYRVRGRDNCKKISKTLHCHASLGTESKLCCCRHFFGKISRLHIMHFSALRWTEFHQNHKDPIWREKTANF